MPKPEIIFVKIKYQKTLIVNRSDLSISGYYRNVKEQQDGTCGINHLLKTETLSWNKGERLKILKMFNPLFNEITPKRKCGCDASNEEHVDASCVSVKEPEAGFSRLWSWPERSDWQPWSWWWPFNHLRPHRSTFSFSPGSIVDKTPEHWLKKKSTILDCNFSLFWPFLSSAEQPEHQVNKRQSSERWRSWEFNRQMIRKSKADPSDISHLLHSELQFLPSGYLALTSWC